MANVPPSIIGERADEFRKAVGNDPRIEGGETLAILCGDPESQAIEDAIDLALRTGSGLTEAALAHTLLSQSRRSIAIKEDLSNPS